MSTILPFSEACERNKDPILEVISDCLESKTYVLEIGSGTGQHALHFANAHPHLSWQTSDQGHYLPGLHAQVYNAKIVNVLSPIELDVRQTDWNTKGETYDVIYTANTLHIMSAIVVEAFFKGVSKVMKPKGVLVVYGPFKYNNSFTSSSNKQFDESLRSRGEGSCIKDFEWVNELAEQAGLSLLADHAMPANNQCIIWLSE